MSYQKWSSGDASEKKDRTTLQDSDDLPSNWKMEIISPIFKKGNREMPSNYRPV